MAEHREPEIWKAIPGYEGLYEVSNHGRIKRLARYRNHPKKGFSLLSEKIVSQHLSHGYYRVELTFNKKSKKKQVHVLVASAFISDNNKSQVNHIDGDKTNNYYKNLEWVNQRENQTHRFLRNETTSKYPGVRFHKRKKSKVWQAGVGINGKDVYLGYYETEEEAYQAYLHALKQYNLTNKYAL